MLLLRSTLTWQCVSIDVDRSLSFPASGRHVPLRGGEAESPPPSSSAAADQRAAAVAESLGAGCLDDPGWKWSSTIAAQFPAVGPPKSPHHVCVVAPGGCRYVLLPGLRLCRQRRYGLRSRQVLRNGARRCMRSALFTAHLDQRRRCRLLPLAWSRRSRGEPRLRASLVGQVHARVRRVASCLMCCRTVVCMPTKWSVTPIVIVTGLSFMTLAPAASRATPAAAARS